MKTSKEARPSYLPPEVEVRVVIISTVIAASNWNSAEIQDNDWNEMYDL